MTIQLKHLGTRPSPKIDSLIEEQLLQFADRQSIEEAKVDLQKQHLLSPPFRVAISLIMPGLDEFVEARDHTLQAAALKALKKLDSALKMRQKKEKLRLRSNQQFPAARTHQRNNSFGKRQ